MMFKHPALVRQRLVSTPLGAVRLARTPAGLAGLWFDGQRHSPDAALWTIDESDPLLDEAQQQLQNYLAGRHLHFDLPLDLSHGTAFQQSVWQALRQIKRGQTISYGALARQIGLPHAARAVGGAVGRNPLSVVVPCHRVMGSDASLTGYAGGLPRKRQLLALEGVITLPEAGTGRAAVPEATDGTAVLPARPGHAAPAAAADVAATAGAVR